MREINEGAPHLVYSSVRVDLNSQVLLHHIDLSPSRLDVSYFDSYTTGYFNDKSKDLCNLFNKMNLLLLSENAMTLRYTLNIGN